MQSVGAAIEAILFIAGDPVNADELAHSLDMTRGELDAELEKLRAGMEEAGSGLLLNRSGDSLFLSIRPELADQVEKFLQPQKRQSLSQAVLETLSIIAYRQPVTKADVEAIRGVKCDYSIQSLVSKGFIEEAGRLETLGRPILYKTTDEFLRHFALSSLDELPEVMEPGEETAGD